MRCYNSQINTSHCWKSTGNNQETYTALPEFVCSLFPMEMSLTPSCYLCLALWHSQAQLNLLFYQPCKQLESLRGLVICLWQETESGHLVSAPLKTASVLSLPLSVLSGSVHSATQHMSTGQAATAPDHRERCEHGEKKQNCAWRLKEKGYGENQALLVTGIAEQLSVLIWFA